MSTTTEQETSELEGYRQWLEEEERYTGSTIDSYVSAARSFDSFLDDREPDLELHREWIADMVATGKASSTINVYHSYVCKYVDFLGAEYDPSRAAGKLPDYDPEEIPDPLTREEIREMGLAAGNPEERYIVVLLYHTALRNVEFREITWDDIDWEKHELSIRRRKKKGWGRDTLPLFEMHMEVLEDLREWRDDGNPYLLPASTGTVSPGSSELNYKDNGQRSDRGLSNRIKSIAKRAGIERDVWPHLFRHTRLTHMLEEGRSITEVNEWADHDKIETTMRYARLTGETLREASGADSSWVFKEDEEDAR